MYGNTRLLLSNLIYVRAVFGKPTHDLERLAQIEQEIERQILKGGVLVTGIHNATHQRAAVVPLRWGAPRILVFSGGFHYHLGQDLAEEPFRAARLWRYKFDPLVDLVVSRRAPDRKPTYALHNPTVDRLIERIATRQVPGILFEVPNSNAPSNSD